MEPSVSLPSPNPIKLEQLQLQSGKLPLLQRENSGLKEEAGGMTSCRCVGSNYHVEKLNILLCKSFETRYVSVRLHATMKLIRRQFGDQYGYIKYGYILYI